jgi:chemotaxis protein methyltransferase CheR
MSSHSNHVLVKQIGTLIEQRTGLAVNAQFRNELEPLLRGLVNGGLEAYLQQLRASSETSALWQKLIYTLTIGETYFFRDQAHFRLLREHILPSIALQRRGSSKPVLAVWSAGCATGEEPYSIAIMLHEFFPDLARWQMKLFGTDLNANSLHAAERGVYRQWSFRHTEDALRSRHFRAVQGGWQIKPHIQSMVAFRHANLFAGAPLPQFDVIFCRNVLIYFDDAHIQQIEDIFFNALAPGGWLLLGQAEALHVRRERWQTHIFPGTVVYQKPVGSGKAYHLERHTQPSIDIPATPALPPAATYQNALAAAQRDDGAQAERLLAELLAQQPQHAAAHTLLAYIFANRRALPEAHTHLDQALRIDALAADAHYLRGMLLMEDGKRDEARKALDAALYCRPTHPLALFMLGNLHAQAGELKRAHRVWEKVRSIVATLPSDKPVSDLSDLTASGLDALVGHRIEGKEPKRPPQYGK